LLEKSKPYFEAKLVFVFEQFGKPSDSSCVSPAKQIAIEVTSKAMWAMHDQKGADRGDTAQSLRISSFRAAQSVQKSL
jgi:hypothetical protein